MLKEHELNAFGKEGGCLLFFELFWVPFGLLCLEPGLFQLTCSIKLLHAHLDACGWPAVCHTHAGLNERE